MPDMENLITDLIAAHRAGTRFEPEIRALERSEVLKIQSAVCDTLGAVAGFKVGAQPDGPPVLAPMMSVYSVKSGGTRKVADRLGIELEVGFELLRDLPGDALPDNPQDYFRPCVMLELVDTRLTGPAATDPGYKFADFQLNAGSVKGDSLTTWDGSDFGALEARLTAGDETILDGPCTVPGGSALANLDLLLRHLGSHCGGLQPGRIAITGSLCGLPYFGPGTEIHGSINGIGAVAVTLV